MKNRLIQLIELFTRWILASGMLYGPKKYEDWFAETLFKGANHLREKRFNAPTGLCDTCGFVFPRDDLNHFTSRHDGRRVLECTDCVDFAKMVRAVFASELA